MRYDLIGDSSHIFTELLAAAWAALWYLSSELCGIPVAAHSDSMYTVWHNRMTLSPDNSVCGNVAHLCQTFVSDLCEGD